MKICVLGLTHLGTVIAICASQKHDVLAFDYDDAVAENSAQGKLPVFEAGLQELQEKSLKEGKLKYSGFPDDIAGSDALWVCYDTPVNEQNQGDVGFVLEKLESVLCFLKTGARILLSSQLPVGTCGKLEKSYPQFKWAVSPENLQLGKAVKCFMEPERVIIGVRELGEDAFQWTSMFPDSARSFVWMSPESAEMTKHALNCFLSMSIAFANEVGRICEKTGADVRDVERALKSDVRIGPNARLQAGSAYEGSSLAREVSNLTNIGKQYVCGLSLIPAIAESNNKHRNWTFDKVDSLFPAGRPKFKAALLGLTFKPGTHTIKRSGAIALAKQLHEAGYKVSAYDPANPELPKEFQFIEKAVSVEQAVFDADVAVLCTPWPEFLKVDWKRVVERGMRQRVIVDANGFLNEVLHGVQVEYKSVGRPSL